MLDKSAGSQWMPEDSEEICKVNTHFNKPQDTWAIGCVFFVLLPCCAWPLLVSVVVVGIYAYDAVVVLGVAMLWLPVTCGGCCHSLAPRYVLL